MDDKTREEAAQRIANEIVNEFNKKTANEQAYRYKKNNRFLVILLILITVLAIGSFSLLFFFMYQKGNEETKGIDVKPTTTISHEIDDDTPDVIYATLPGYSTTYYLNKEKTSVPLLNLSENTINLVYELLYEDKVILTTDELKPGEGLDADLYNYFGSEGSYTIFINVYTKLPDGADGDPMKFVMNLVIE